MTSNPATTPEGVRAWTATLCRLVLGVVWIWAAAAKIADPRAFVQTVRAFDATPEWLSEGIAYGVPVLALCLGLVLLVGIVVRISAAASAVLLVVFLIGLVQAAVRDRQVSCGCFGTGGETLDANYVWPILLVIVLLAAAAMLVWHPFSYVSGDSFLARHDRVEVPSAKRMRTEQGRRKYESQLAEKAKSARERTLYLNSLISVVAVLVAVVAIGVQADRAKLSASSAGHTSVANGVVYGKKAAATVDIYEDFQCPNCRSFEQAIAAKLERDVVANLAQVRYHPIALLDAATSTGYSSRAANAALCAADVSVDFFVAYHDYLFGSLPSGGAVQPAAGSSGRSDKELIGYAASAKIPAAKRTTFATCVDTQQHKTLVQAMTARASRAGVTTMPVVKVNGTTLHTHTLAALSAAIAAADAKGPKPSPSPTATATPSTTATPTTSSGGSSTSTAPSPSGSGATSPSYPLGTVYPSGVPTPSG